MNLEGKLECVLDQEIVLKQTGLQTTFTSAILVLEDGHSISITTEVARQIRQWKAASRLKITGIGEPLMEIECLN
jgi:hypothetical protein